MGGGPRRRHIGSDARRQRPGQSAGGILERPPAAAARPGPAGRRRGGRRPLRGRDDPCPQGRYQTTARTLRTARVDVEVRSAAGALMALTAKAPTRAGTRLATLEASLVPIDE